MNQQPIPIVSVVGHETLASDSLIVFDRNHKNCSYNISVFIDDEFIGKAEGFRYAVLGQKEAIVFQMHQYDKSKIPDKYLFRGFLFAKNIIGVGNSWGSYPRMIYLGTPEQLNLNEQVEE